MQQDQITSVSPNSTNAVLPAVLRLTLKKKWFDMIASGEKKEEYREIKHYWMDRLIKKGDPGKWTNKDENGIEFNKYDFVEFRNGYAKTAPTMLVESKGISVGKARPEWSEGFSDDCFIISLGNVVLLTA